MHNSYVYSNCNHNISGIILYMQAYCTVYSRVHVHHSESSMSTVTLKPIKLNLKKSLFQDGVRYKLSSNTIQAYTGNSTRITVYCTSTGLQWLQDQDYCILSVNRPTLVTGLGLLYTVRQQANTGYGTRTTVYCTSTDLHWLRYQDYCILYVNRPTLATVLGLLYTVRQQAYTGYGTRTTVYCMSSGLHWLQD